MAVGGVMYRLQEHAAAALFPEMDKKRYTELRLSIREHGLLNSIVLYQGEILDGRNRYQACIDENVAPRFEDYAGNPFQYAWMVNGEHSRKPEDFREAIDFLYPHGPRLELFRRGAAPDGWQVWGNEVE